MMGRNIIREQNWGKKKKAGTDYVLNTEKLLDKGYVTQTET